jgi:GH24 family phage-related lysozyme (muramidase)
MVRDLLFRLRRAARLALIPALLLAAAAANGAPSDQTTGSAAISSPLRAAVWTLTEALPAKRPAPINGLISERAIALIVSYEVGSPELYARKYSHPIYPGGASGVTIGIGYDLGMTAPRVILADWERHPDQARLVDASGVSGPASLELVHRMADISVDYELARYVFDQSSLVSHFRAASRSFGRGFDQAGPGVQGALTSLVFNCGGSMAGERRAEMRTIRDVCLPARDAACTAQQLRTMTRIWRGSSIELGMERRRNAEADLALTDVAR